MTPPDNDALDDFLIARLEKYRELLDAGDNDDTAEDRADESTDLTAETLSRLLKAKSCLKVLATLKRQRRSPFQETARGSGSRRFAADPAPPTFIGRFEILEQLGLGGFGIVYLALDATTNRQVAVKIPRFETLATNDLMQRFEQEAKAAARLDHPNIVPILEAGLSGPIPYIASVYYAAPTLAKWLDDDPEPVAPRDAAELVRQLALGLQHAHDRGVLHRDVKPSNVLMTSAPGGGFVPKLTDFGLAKLAESNGDLTRSGAMLGTVKYMSPEQAAGRIKAVGPGTEVYALGVVLYELLTHRAPFDGETDIETLRMIREEEPTSIRSLRRDSSDDLETICLKCLEKEPARRYSSARELADDLHRFLAGEPIRARPVNSIERLIKWARRRPALASLIGVTILAVVSLLVLSTLHNLRLSNALAESRNHEKRAEERALVARQHAYVGSMSLLSRDAKKMRLEEQLSLLEAYIPKDGEPDVRGFEWWLFWRRLRLDQPYRKIGDHKGGAKTAAIEPTGRLGATGGNDGVVRLWKMPDGAASGELNPGSNSPVNDIAFSPNGSHLAAATDEGTVLLWKLDDPTTPRALKGHTSWAASVAFSPDGKTLASGGDRRVLLWDFPNGKKRSELTGHTDTPRDLMFSRDGALLISAGEDGTIRAWDVAAGAPSKTVPDGIIGEFEDCWPRKLVLEPSGDTFVALFNRKERPLYWKLQPKFDSRAKSVISLDGSPRCVSIFADEKENRAAFGLENGAILTPRYPGGDIDVSDRFLGHRAPVDALAVTSDGRSLLSCDARGSVLLWDIAKGSAAYRIFSGPRVKTAATIAPSGSFFAAMKDTYISIVDGASGQIRASWPFEGIDGFPYPAIAPNEDMLAVCDSKNRVHFLSLPDGKELGVVALPEPPVTVRFSPDGARAVACAKTRTHILTVRPSAESRVLNGTSSHGAAFLDSTRLLTPCVDGNLRLWDVGLAEPLDVIPVSDRELGGIALSPDRAIAAVGGYCAVFIVDLASRKVIATLPHNSDVNDLFFFPEARLS